MTFDEWQAKHGPNGAAYDIDMQRAGWNAALKERDRESRAANVSIRSIEDICADLADNPIGLVPELERVLRNLMGAYERRIRSLCETPQQLERQPWRCAEYTAAENALSNVVVLREGALTERQAADLLHEHVRLAFERGAGGQP